MIHKAIKDILVEKIKPGFEISSAQPEEQSSKAKRHKKRAKICKITDAKIDEVYSENEENTEQTDEPQNISINEAQIEFDKLFGGEMIKLDATVQKHIIGMNTVISEELFDSSRKLEALLRKGI
ncbi:hypothetical protein FF1_038395 [Malus domestica]